jgi:predicted permease
MFNGLGADLRFAWRQLLHRPAFSLLAILTLSLGIGGAVSLFSVVNGLLLRPLPYAEEARTVVFWSASDWMQAEYDFVREEATGFSAIGAYANASVALRGEHDTQVVEVNDATAPLFEVLGARMQLGRGLEPSDNVAGAEPVVVLSHGLWQQRFGAAPDVVGRRIVLDGRPTTVVGVAARGFHFPNPEARAWRALVIEPSEPIYASNGYLTFVARIAPGVDADSLQPHVDALAAKLGDRFDYPDAWDKSRGAHVVPLREFLVGDAKPAVLLLFGAVLLLLLIACANVSALVLARTVDRMPELALRGALGAGARRLARELLAESVLLALIAAVVATAVAAIFFETLVGTLPLPGGLAETLRLDWRLFAAALALALVAGLGVGVVPALRVLTGHVEQVLARGRSQGGAGETRTRAHSAMIVVEALLAVLMVTSATLLIRTVDSLRSVDTGIAPDGVLVLDVAANAAEMDAPARAQFYDALVREAAALPGVSHAGIINRLPLRDPGWQGPMAVESRPDLAGAAQPNVAFRTGSPDLFAALGMRLLSGRFPGTSDGAGGPMVAAVSESFARDMWPGRSAIGQRLGLGGDRWVTVVGVVADVRLFNLGADNPYVMYMPQAQRSDPGNANVLVLRSNGDPRQLAAPVRELVRRLDPRVAVARVATMREVHAGSMAGSLRLRFFLSLFAGLGLLLGAIGVYSVVSHTVVRRRGEYGIRLALGASPLAVMQGVLRRAMAPVAIGVTLGVVATLAVARVLAGLLHGVGPADPASIGFAAFVLLATGVLAASIPAAVAARTPSATLLQG